MRDLAERGGQISAAVQREPKPRHGRREERRRWALADPEVNAYLGWPRSAQICRVERYGQQVRQRQVVQTEHEVEFCDHQWAPERADATVLLRTIRGHWGIENQTHYVRDVTFDEDRSQIRSGAAPQAFAATRTWRLRCCAARPGSTSPRPSAPTRAGSVCSASSPQQASPVK